MKVCYICQQDSVELKLDLGLQPISNRFLKEPTKHEFMHTLCLGYCKTCGLSQLIDPAPSIEVKPHFDWIRYNEPEGHLDDVVLNLIQLEGVTSNSVILGITEKDDSTLVRLNKKGFTRTSRLDAKKDLEIHDTHAGIETIQQFLTEEFSREYLKKKGRIQIVLARHILEHAHNPLQFIRALKKLVEPNGYVVFEVPDNTRVFNNFDYSILWEEHVIYFTPSTFLQTLKLVGFEIIFYKNYPYSMENSMVVVAKINHDQGKTKCSSLILDEEEKRIQNYCKRFLESKQKIHKILKQYNEQGPVVLLGAGHLAVHFINLMGIKDYLQFIVDDHPQKAGLLMPGSQLPILPSCALLDRQIKSCLMSVSHENEPKVMNNKKSFITAGGQFYSIFPTSQYALKDTL